MNRWYQESTKNQADHSFSGKVRTEQDTLPYKFDHVSGNYVPAGKSKTQRELVCLIHPWCIHRMWKSAPSHCSLSGLVVSTDNLNTKNSCATLMDKENTHSPFLFAESLKNQTGASFSQSGTFIWSIHFEFWMLRKKHSKQNLLHSNLPQKHCMQKSKLSWNADSPSQLSKAILYSKTWYN